MKHIIQFFSGGLLNTRKADEIAHRTFLHIEHPTQEYTAFIICLALSAIIATCGLAVESAAIIIGAMIIAPLMSPMIGASFAVTTGKPRDALHMLLLSLAGASFVIVIACFVTLILPAGVNLDENREILSRVSPRVADLIVALASGFLAALAVARKDLSETIPGIALSISIVPPLCVVGASLVSGEMDMALGALLLFTANFFSIQIAGYVMFLLLNYGVTTRKNKEKKVRTYVIAATIAGTMVLAIPLIAASNSIVRQYTVEETSRNAVETWLSDSDYRSKTIEFNNNRLVIEIAGTGAYPDITSLKNIIGPQDGAIHEISVIVVEEYTESLRDEP